MKESAIWSTGSLAARGKFAPTSLQELVGNNFSLHAPIPGICRRQLPLAELVNQHVQVVREQGWDAMYDY